MIFTDKQLAKLILPVHIIYIQKNILNITEEQTREIINRYVDEGILEESKYGKDYYSLKKQ